MPDTPQLTVIKELTAAQKKTNELLTTVNESIKAQAKIIAAPPPRDVEGDKEKKAGDKKFLESLKGILKSAGGGVVDGGKSMLDGIKKMMSKYKKIIMGLLGVGLVAIFSQLNMKQLGEIWTSFMGALESIYNTMKPIVVGIAKWIKEKALPITVEAIIAQFKLITKVFEDLGETFKGWENMTLAEKFKSVMSAIGKIGNYFTSTAANIMNWGANLLGYEGSLSKDIKAKWTEWFSSAENPDSLMSKMIHVFKAIGGLFLFGALFKGGIVKTMLQAPLRLALKGMLFGAKGAGGFIGKVGSIISKIPLAGIGKGLMGVAKGVGILGLATAVGVGLYDGYKVIAGGGTVQKAFETGIEGFLRIVTGGLLSPDIAKSWSKSIVSFFKSAYDLVFNKKEQERVTGEFRKQTKKGATKAALKGGEDELKSQREALVQEAQRLDPRDAARKAQINRSIKEINEALGVEKPVEPTKTVPPASIISAPVKIKKGAVDWGFISSKEGGSKLEGYVPDPDGSKSGVTIATGFDLGARNEKDLAGLSPALINKLAPFVGLKGQNAVLALKIKKGLKITAKEAKEIDAMSKGSAMSKLKGEWNKRAKEINGTMFADLSSGQKTIAASVAFQYGSLSKTPKFRNAMQTGDWEGAASELDDFNDNYGGRRAREAAYLRNDTGIQLAMLQKSQTAGGTPGTGAINVQTNRGGDTTQNFTATNAVGDDNRVQEEKVSVPA